MAHKLRGGKGIEIGGPSGVFARDSVIPIYPLVDELDNCNFSNNTIWEGTISGGRSFRFDPKRQPGRQYISEATDLHGIPSGIYDFVASSHVLEHVANPLKALHEWSRISKPTGKLLLVLPHRDGTFDHRRPVTSIEHMVSDYNSNVCESDTTHLPEVLNLHDIDLDPAVTHREELVARFQANRENRCIHHHVFTTRSAATLLAKAGYAIDRIEAVSPFHIVALAHKSGLQEATAALVKVEKACRRSPFMSDQEPETSSRASAIESNLDPTHVFRKTA